MDPEVNVKRLERYYTLGELKQSPFSVIFEPTTFNAEGAPTKIFAEDITKPKLTTFSILGKMVSHISA